MQLRQNHTKNSNGSNSMIRILVFAILLIGLLYFGWDTLIELTTAKEFNAAESMPGVPSNDDHLDAYLDYDAERPYLPTSTSGAIVNHKYFSLSYKENHEQAEWVCYPLTRALLRKPNVPRTDHFEKDPDVKTESLGYYAYRGSGYTRGHLAPAGDMAFSYEAMRESFFMSNISPQLRSFNNGIWRELEEQTRDWVWNNEFAIIASGPVLTRGLDKVKNKGLSVPKLFYKIILDNHGSDKKAIAFLIPHEVSDKPLQDYAVTVDEIEKITGIDFFLHLFNDETEEQIESNIDLSDWKFSDKRYRLRVDRWNYE